MPKKKTVSQNKDAIRKVQFANLVGKVKQGKSLTAADQRFLDSYEEEGSITDTESLNIVDNEAIIRTADLVDFLGISAVRVSELVKDGVAVKKSHGRYFAAKSIKNYIRMLQKGRKSKHGSSATMEELRQRLIDEQGRKEAAMASLRELELKMKRESLIPESEAAETLMRLLTPLRRLLDALPRQCAATANPKSPQIAELAIRNALDDRVFAEVEKIMKTAD